MLAVFICYIDRVNISITIIPMAEELGWDYERIGLVSASFFIGYIVTQILGGYLSDKYGAKLVLGYGLIIWSLFTILTPVASYASFTFLILARIGMGLGEGITFPAWHSLYARWVPLGERARAVGVTNSGLFLGTVFALITTPIIVLQLGWEWAFYLFGSVGFIWFFFWNRFAVSSPKEHANISEQELGQGWEFIQAFDKIFGLIKSDQLPEIPIEITHLANQRDKARKMRDWAEADSFRQFLKSKGWIVEDTPNGQQIKKQS